MRFESVATACAVAAALAVVPVVVVPTTASAWSNLESRSRLSSSPFSAYDSNGLVVADGRVWWLEGQYTEFQAKGFVLASQSLRGGAVRRVVLAASAMQSPVHEGYAGYLPSARVFRMRDGLAVVSGDWSTPITDPGDHGLGPNRQFLASFDPVSGALVKHVNLQSAVNMGYPTLIKGDPAVLASPTGGLSRTLSNPLTGAEFPVRLGPESGPEVGGRYFLGFPGAVDPAVRWKTVRVRELATGRVQYRVSARQITRAAGLPAGTPTSVWLMDDGSLKVALTARGRAARPVAVDPRGRIRRIGGSIRGAEEIQATIGHGRAFVYVAKPRGKRDLYERLWMTDAAGKRGRALRVSDRNGSARVLPFFWDGRSAVWSTETRRDDLGTWVERNVPRSRLRSSDVPARWRP